MGGNGMNTQEGRMREKQAEGLRSFPLDYMPRVDMRAVDELRVGSQVCVLGTAFSGKIAAFDADRRLAKVNIPGKSEHWFYVRDLRVIDSPARSHAISAISQGTA
jgi:hypothetical protein